MKPHSYFGVALAAAIMLGLSGCEGPVDPAKVKLRYESRIAAPDAVVVMPPLDVANSGTLVADPGERVTLRFWLVDGVRDQVFLQFDETTAYVAGVTLFDGHIARNGTEGIAAGVAPPPSPDPSVTAPTYRRILPSPRTPRGVVVMAPPVDTYIPVTLSVQIPKSDFEHAEVSVVFHLHGFTRNPAGEFRDTLVKKITIGRRPHPATATRVAP